MNQIKYIPYDAWKHTGPPEFPAARLLTSLRFECFGPEHAQNGIDYNGVFCYVSAVAVVEQTTNGPDGPRLMVAAHDDHETELDAVVTIVGERPQTVRIGPHDYVLSVTPFGE